MNYRIIAVLLLSLMLSMLFMPLAVSADNGKSIIKGMVQSPTDYSVGIIISPYVFWELDRHWPIMDRPYMWPWPFMRLILA